MLITAAPRPVLRLLLIMPLLGVLVAFPRACETDPRPSGYHSPNAAFGDGELGLVWLNRQGARESVMFALAGDRDAKLKTRPAAVSSNARGSDAPLIAHNGRGYLVVWTHHQNAPGLYALAVKKGMPQGKEVRLLERSVTACRQLVWANDRFALAWLEGGNLRVGFLNGSAASLDDGGLTQAVLATAAELDAPGATSCRLAYDGQDLGLVWAGGDKKLHLARLSLEGEVKSTRELAGPATAEALTMSDDEVMAAYTVAGEPGGHIVRLGRSLDDRGRIRLDRGGSTIASLDVVDFGQRFALWAETKVAGAARGTVFLARLDDDGTPNAVQRMSPKNRADLRVNMTRAGQRAAVTFSDRRDSGTVSWALFKTGGRDAEVMQASIAADESDE